MGILTTNLSNLKFVGDFDRSDLRRLLAALHQIRNAGFSSVNLDFTQLQHAHTSDILPFAINSRYWLHRGFEIRIELPEEKKLRRLFENANWAHIIDPRSFDKSSFDSKSHLPAILYTNPDEQYAAVERVINLVLRNLELTDRQQLASIEWSVNEIADNVLNHASSPVGGAVQVSARLEKGLIEYVVCDAGLSIPRTLRESHPEISSDSAALDRAIREGVTRNQKTNMGNGLYGSYRLAQLSGGHFQIYSGYASLKYSPKSGLHVQREQIPYQGSLVVCAIRISDPELLSEALTFRDVRHTPFSVTDRIDEDESTEIRLSEESNAFGSRPAAKPVRIKLENLLRTTDAQLIINLDDVALISSSFADEVFGKIFIELGPLEFMGRVRISGGNKIVRQLIDRAIAQRAALGTPKN